jgi:hypothetical protein
MKKVYVVALSMMLVSMKLLSQERVKAPKLEVQPKVEVVAHPITPSSPRRAAADHIITPPSSKHTAGDDKGKGRVHRAPSSFDLGVLAESDSSDKE